MFALVANATLDIM